MSSARGTELMTVISGVKSWKRRRSCRGMLHDDDDDDDDDEFLIPNPENNSK